MGRSRRNTSWMVHLGKKAISLLRGKLGLGHTGILAGGLVVGGVAV